MNKKRLTVAAGWSLAAIGVLHAAVFLLARLGGAGRRVVDPVPGREETARAQR